MADRLRGPELAGSFASVIDEVAAHRLDPYAATDRLLAGLRIERGP
jgi:hypothetical protein